MPAEPDPDAPARVQPRLDGPLVITGRLELLAPDGSVVEACDRLFLCRCGGSATKPICDGSHKHNGFRAPGLAPPRKPDRP